MRPRLVVLVAAAAVLLLGLPGGVRADGSVTVDAVCSTGPSSGPCSAGWYTTNVTVSFSLSGSGFTIVSGCTPTTVSSDTAGVQATCEVDTGGGNIVGKVVTIKRDATPPTASGITAARSPDANGWYNHPVGVSTTGSDSLSGIASCTSTTYAGPDSSSASVVGTCRDNAGNVSAPQTLAFKYDASAPTIDAAASRGPDANGWYNHPVDVKFSGSDATSGIDSCTSATYSGPDSASASVSGTCRDAAGNSATRAFGLQYDATPPSTTGASPDRPADSGGWYNHQLVVTFAGSDATSGIASCDAVTYSKPDDPSASVQGRCRDNAGNSGEAVTFGFKYDSTPPKLDAVSARPLDRSAVVAWKASADAVRVTVARAAGTRSGATVFDGRSTGSFTDKRLRNGVRYTYTVSAQDAAGNAVSRKLVAEPSPALLAPRRVANAGRGTTLRWRPVPGATYYNVQLRLRGAKVLTAWPSSTSFHVPPTWSLAGRSYRLVPGRYVWAVWPGFGKQARHRYGPLIGTSTFVVSR